MWGSANERYYPTQPHHTPPQGAKKQQKHAAVYQACANYPANDVWLSWPYTKIYPGHTITRYTDPYPLVMSFPKKYPQDQYRILKILATPTPTFR